MKLEIKALTPALWPAYEKLFGSNGACGGCWCMWWRIEKGERWDEVKGPRAKRRMKALVASRKAQGFLAFDADEPVGWLASGPRKAFPRLDRAPSLACDDAERVWSLPCFFIRRGWRGKGVATSLLQHAVRALERRGVKRLEGYPVEAEGAMPAAFAWTGPASLFRKAGFSPADRKAKGKRRYRRAA